MITVRISKAEGKIIGFEAEGHALFGEAGNDVVCSAVSMLVINTINSIECFTDDEASVLTEKDGFISFDLASPPSHEAALLLDSMQLGLETVEKTYGKEYITVKISQ